MYSDCLFDAQESSAAILKVENGVIKDNVWLLDFDGREFFNMRVGIEEYLRLAYKAKLFDGWQFVYVLEGEVKKSFEGYELMKRMLPKLIPHIEIDFKAFGIE